MCKISKRFHLYLVGVFTGIANGLFGSGGGIISVSMLEKEGLEAKKAHATSLAITLPLSLVSGYIYFSKGSFDLIEAMKFIPFGLVGVIVGAKLLHKIPNRILKKIFGVMMIIFGIRFLKG